MGNTILRGCCWEAVSVRRLFNVLSAPSRAILPVVCAGENDSHPQNELQLAGLFVIFDYHSAQSSTVSHGSGDQSPLSAGTPRHRDVANNGAGMFSEVSPLRKRLQDTADDALAEGITVPMHTTFEVVRSGDAGDEDQGGMDFIVSIIASKALGSKVMRASRRAKLYSVRVTCPRAKALCLFR